MGRFMVNQTRCRTGAFLLILDVIGTGRPRPFWANGPFLAPLAMELLSIISSPHDPPLRLASSEAPPPRLSSMGAGEVGNKCITSHFRAFKAQRRPCFSRVHHAHRTNCHVGSCVALPSTRIGVSKQNGLAFDGWRFAFGRCCRLERAQVLGPVLSWFAKDGGRRPKE